VSRRGGEIVEGFFQNAAQGTVDKLLMTVEIESARQDFWRNYPNGPDFTRARREFDRLLFSKDQIYLLLLLSVGIPERAMAAAWAIAGGEIDGGIAEGAQPAYRMWVEDIRARLGARPGERLAPAAYLNLRAAVNQSTPALRRYLIRRDLEEFRVRGQVPPGWDSTFWKTLTLLVATRPWESKLPGDRVPYGGFRGADQYDDAHTHYSEIEAVLGAGHVRAVSTRIMSAADKGRVPAPDDYGSYTEPNLYQAFVEHLGSGDARRFLIGQIRKSFSPDTQYNWLQAQKFYDDMVRESGEAAVLEIAERLRKAPKTTERQSIMPDTTLYNLLASPSSIGCSNPRVRYCMDELLRRRREADATNAGRTPVTPGATGAMIANFNGVWKKDLTYQLGAATLLIRQDATGVAISGNGSNVQVLRLDGPPDRDGNVATIEAERSLSLAEHAPWIAGATQLMAFPIANGGRPTRSKVMR
jgi:hypothetical protein